MAANVVRRIPPQWHLVDGDSQRVGRLAAYCASILQGKHKPTYTPHVDCGDNIVITNASKLIFTGKKYTDKLYRWHSGFPGGLKTLTPKIIVEDKGRPEELLLRAVKGMLPNNKLRDQRLSRLRVFANDIDVEKLKTMKLMDETRGRRVLAEIPVAPIDNNGKVLFDVVTQPPKRPDLRKYFK